MKRAFLQTLCIVFELTTVQLLFAQSNPLEIAAERGASSLHIIARSDELSPSWWNTATIHTIDTANLEVVYNLKYRRKNRIGTYYEMLTILQIGTAKQKYYSLIRKLIDDVQHDVWQHSHGTGPVPNAGYNHIYTQEELYTQQIAGRDLLNSEIWVDFALRELTERTHDYDKDNLSIEYDEPWPAFDWQLQEQTDTIAGYTCISATTHFRGRDWTVWFASDIPICSGPWKFNGLPGLILKAQDNEQDFIWECTGIRQKKEIMTYYEVARKLLSRKQWQQYLRRLHEDPLTMLGNGGDRLFFHKFNEITENDHWTIPYNPIELE